MELLELNAKPRESKGKGAARKLRSNNGIPAIMYGPKSDPMMITLETIEFHKLIRENGTTGIFLKLKVEGETGKRKIVMLKDLQMDTFGLKYLHADLQEVDMDVEISVTVPVETIGECPGAKEGGMLQIIRRELDVLCKPEDTPESVEIDISELNIGDSVHVEDIDLGELVTIPHEVDFTVVTIVPPTTGDAEEETEEEEDYLAEGEVEEPEE